MEQYRKPPMFLKFGKSVTIRTGIIRNVTNPGIMVDGEIGILNAEPNELFNVVPDADSNAFTIFSISRPEHLVFWVQNSNQCVKVFYDDNNGNNRPDDEIVRRDVGYFSIFYKNGRVIAIDD